VKLGKAVKAIKVEEGVTTVITTLDSVTLGLAPTDQVAQAERLVKSTVVTQTIDIHGRVVTSDASRSTDSLLVGGLEAVHAIGFSPSPVKVGDRWRAAAEYSGSKLEVELRLERVFSQRGKQLAEMRIGTVGPAGVDPDMPITLLVDAATGVLERLELLPRKGVEGKSMRVLIRMR
jgi:hypothetical protein